MHLNDSLQEEHIASTSMDQRQRLLNVTDRMQKNNQDLDHAIALTEESIQVGIDVMTNLEEQKSTMQRIIERVSRVNGTS
jgi:hypothetical protein